MLPLVAKHKALDLTFSPIASGRLGVFHLSARYSAIQRKELYDMPLADVYVSAIERRV
jgi:hypothetical protein